MGMLYQYIIHISHFSSCIALAEFLLYIKSYHAITTFSIVLRTYVSFCEFYY